MGDTHTPAVSCHQACKPGSVPLTRRWPFLLDAPCGAPRATNPGGSSGNETGRSPCRAAPIRSCSRWGLPCRPCCQGRGALLPAPFHPYRSVRLRTERRFAFCCTVPRVTPAGHYPAPCFRGARTFLSALIRNTGGAAIRPADTGNKGFSACSVKALPAGWLLWRAGAGDDHAAFDLRRYRALLLDVFHDVVGDEACLLRVNQHLGLG